MMYYFIADTLFVYPEPSSLTVLKMRYLSFPAAVTSSTLGAQIPLPGRHQRLIVLGTLQKLYDMEDDQELAQRFQQLYESRLQTMRQDLWRKQWDRPEYVHIVDDELDDYIW